MSSKRFDLVGPLALSGTVLCWSTTPVILRHLAGHVDAWTTNGLRYPLAASLYLPVLVLGLRYRVIDRSLFRRALGPALFSFSGQVLWALAPYHLEASMIGFLVKVSVVWAMLGAMALFPDERALLRRPRFHLGLVIAVAGFVVLTVSRATTSTEVSATGVAIILGCSACFGLYGVSVRYFLQDVKPLFAFGAVSQYVALGTLILAPVGDPSRALELSARDWGLLVSSAFLAISLSHVLYFTAIQRLGATIATAGHLLGPFVTLALSFVFLGEALTAREWCAGAAIVAGAAILFSAQPGGTTRRAEATRGVGDGGLDLEPAPAPETLRR